MKKKQKKRGKNIQENYKKLKININDIIIYKNNFKVNIKN